MATLKSIRLGKQLKYELLLVFEKFQGMKVKEIFEKLPKGYCSLATLYNYHKRWKYAERKYRELIKNF
jgi:hypothetical protein